MVVTGYGGGGGGLKEGVEPAIGVCQHQLLCIVARNRQHCVISRMLETRLSLSHHLNNSNVSCLLSAPNGNTTQQEMRVYTPAPSRSEQFTFLCSASLTEAKTLGTKV
jgi:hypothetical protein